MARDQILARQIDHAVVDEELEALGGIGAEGPVLEALLDALVGKLLPRP